MGKLKKIEKDLVDKGYFMANGTKYIVEQGFSIERYAMYQRMQLEVGFNLQFAEMFSKWEEVLQLANEQRFADIVILAYNISRGMLKLEEKEPLVLRMCALFINTEDEDVRVITEDMITKKLNDWKEEGIDVNDFFRLALGIISGFMDAWSKLTQSISEAEAAMLQKKS